MRFALIFNVFVLYMRNITVFGCKSTQKKPFGKAQRQLIFFVTYIFDE